MFDIRTHLEFDKSGRAVCPSCSQQGKNQKKNLSLVKDSSGHYTGAYKCHRGCSPKDIREALGSPKAQQIPAALATTKAAPAPVTITPQRVKQQCDRLLASDGPAMKWLNTRGITREMAAHYQLGIIRCKVGNTQKWAIAIPIPNDDKTAYYNKKRVCPWDESAQKLPEYQPWKQYGIPQRVYFTHLPPSATETWLCEGEWDAIALGWMLREQEEIAVACFTCGAGNVPADNELDKLPGQVTIFYDRNDKPLKNGDIPGEVGANRAANRIGERARIGLVPMPDDCNVHGWDVSDAINAGFDQAAFLAAAAAAARPRRDNPLRSRLLTNDELMARAPEYVEWLVPDLLTHNELFAVAAPPRGGKSLLAMTLTKCVALGEKFLDRPVSQGAVIYVNLEDSDAKIREREESQGWPPGLPIYWLDKFKLSEIDYLTELIEEIQPRLVILDTLSRVRNDGVAEASAEMSQVLEPLQETAKKHNVCILLIHHTKKVDVEAGAAIDIFDSIRGSGAIRATCRGCIIIAPAENSYRLVAENGHGKHDLRVRLDVNTLEWKLMGHWTPAINIDQREIALDYLNKVGSATIDQIHAGTQIPKRSLYVVLARLVGEDIITKTGTQRAAIYARPVQQVQQLNSLLNCSNENQQSDSGVVQQKNNFFFSNNADSGHPPSGSPLLPQISTSVELGDTGVSNVRSESASAVQQQFNSSLTVELKGEKSDLGVMQEGGDLGVIQSVTGVIQNDAPTDVPDIDGADCEALVGKKWVRAKHVKELEQLKICSCGNGLRPWHRVKYLDAGGKERRKDVCSYCSYVSPLIHEGDEVVGPGGAIAVVKSVGWIYLIVDENGKEVHWKRSDVKLLDYVEESNHANG